MSDVTTEQIRVQVESRFLPEHSSETRSLWVYTYTVTITNIGYQSSQLLRRHWYITDGWGKVQEVEGEGVIGEQPVLHPGESHTYSSFCPLSTPTGSMHGYYTFVRGAGEEFQAEVGLFALGGNTLLN